MRKVQLVICSLLIVIAFLAVGCAKPAPPPAPPSAPAPAPAPKPAPPAVLNIEMEPAGHWHVTRAKTLSFTVTDEGGNPVTGLKPTITVKTHEETVSLINAIDNGDGSYSADYIAKDIGSGYAIAYNVLFSFEREGSHYADAWPVEVVRDGNEGILPTLQSTLYSYQVRYGWDPGSIAAGDEVTMYFEPRRAIQTGDDINTEMPWRNTFNHIIDLENISVVIEAANGSEVATLNPAYAGLGIYRVNYTPTSAGEYEVSFLFTDPSNGFTIDKAETSYPLVVKARS